MIDLTKVINESLKVYPGDPKVVLTHIKKLAKDGYNDYVLTINMHTGTHIDGINHMKEGKKISEISLEQFIGRGKVVSNEFIYQDEEVLIFPPNTHVSKSFIETISTYPIKYIVTEENSIDDYPYELHHILFNQGIMIVENAMNIKSLEIDVLYDVYAIPLKIEADSSPVRLFAKKIK